MSERAPGAPPGERSAGRVYRVRLGNLQCAVTTPHERYATMLADAYGTSVLPDGDGPDPAPDVSIGIRDDVPSERAPAGDRLIVRRVDGACRLESDPMTCIVRADAAPCEVTVVVHDPLLRRDWLTYHFSILFNRALLLLDRVILHAAALAYRGSVSLFVGPKGAGKSTVSIALARAGATVLCEDRLLARRADGRTLVSGCNGRMRVTAKTEGHFLDGQLTSEAFDVAEVPKKEFPAARFFVARPHEERSVDRVFLLRAGDRFEIRPIGGRDALLRAMAATSSMLRFHDRGDYVDFLSRLGDVLGPLPAYDLELSPHLDDLDRLVEFLGRAA